MFLLSLLAVLALGGAGRADEAAPPPSPSVLTLQDALQLFRSKGFDLVLAEANVRAAEADLRGAGRLPNPGVALSYGRVLGYDPSSVPGCSGCSANQYSAGLTDNALLVDLLAGKRGLRKDVAAAALAAARASRADAQRSLEFEVKQLYMQLVAAHATLDFAREVQTSAQRMLDLQKLRYPRVIDEGQLARFETAKLEADQGVDTATQNVRQAQVNLAFLLGMRGVIPEFDIDRRWLRFSVPSRLQATSPAELVRQAYANRPDLRAASADERRAAASIDLARRQRFPDIALNAQYSQTGTGQSSISPPTVTFGVTAPIPLFYQQQGEVGRAEAEYAGSTAARGKVEAQVSADVASAWAAFVGSRRLVERMESSLLERSKRARDITELQFNAGAATLIDFLDAQRTFIATNVEYLQDLTGYWISVFALEQAVGTGLLP